jgi:hypothetical protein
MTYVCQRLMDSGLSPGFREINNLDSLGSILELSLARNEVQQLILCQRQKFHAISEFTSLEHLLLHVDYLHIGTRLPGNSPEAGSLE